MRAVVRICVLVATAFLIQSPALAQSLPSTGSLGADAILLKQSKLDAGLHELREIWIKNGRRLTGIDPDVSTPGLPISDEAVLVDAIASQSGEALKNALVQLGMKDASAFGKVVSGRLPLGALEQLDGVSELQHIRASYRILNAGSVTSQGDVAQRSNIARVASSIDGAGVMVGTLSDSYNCLGGAPGNVASGDLPAGVIVLNDTYCSGATDEGRAMMQIIHDVAPGASQAFHSASGGFAGFANGIQALANAGAEVIVDDFTYFAEPMFQDGIIAQAVNNVTAQGVSYFSSAGNSSNNSYEAPFRSSGTGKLWGAAGSAHDFDAGAGVDLTQSIQLPIGSTLILSFQWAEPYASAGGSGAVSDIDVGLYDAAGINLLAYRTTRNVGADPIETLVWTNNTASTLFNLVFEKYLPAGGPVAPLIKYVIFRSGAPTQYQTNSSTIYGHHNAVGANATGAAAYDDTPAFGTSPPIPESFTSHGGLAVKFDLAGNPINENRFKPDITAPDGANNTFFGNDVEGDGWPNFFGTSAAAPHAAAVAALMLEETPVLDPSSLRQCMQATAVNMLNAGYDVQTGPGLLNAEKAVTPTAPAITSPVASSVLTGTSQTFNWSGPCVNDWWLYVGSSVGGQQYFDSGLRSAGATAVGVAGLPDNGSIVHARLWYRQSALSGWRSVDTTYTATGEPQTGPPSITSPLPGATLVGTTQTFQWSNPGYGQFWLYAGSTLGGAQYHDSGSLGAATSRSVSGLPSNGSTVFVRLWYQMPGTGAWAHVDAQYTSGDPGGLPTVATLLTPSAAGAGSTPMYRWNAVSNATWYYLWVNDTTGTPIRTWYTAAQAGCSAGTGICSVTPATAVVGSATWWIQTWNSIGYGPWSASRTFAP